MGQYHKNSLYTLSGVEFEGEDMASFALHGPMDDEIQALAMAELMSHSELKDLNLSVSVESGTLFLSGVVKQLEIREMAHKWAEEIKGVREIVNKITLVKE